MKARGLARLGTRTREFEETTRFSRDTLVLRVEHEEPDFAIFRLPNGDTVEVLELSDRDHMPFETGPLVGSLVDDVDEARQAGSVGDHFYRSGAGSGGRRYVVPLCGS